LLGAFEQRRGEHHELVGDRQRRKHAAAPDHDAGIGFLLDAGREKGVGLAARGLRTIGLRRNQSVRETGIAFAQTLVVAHCVVAEPPIGLSQERGSRREARDGPIEVVRRPAHHAASMHSGNSHRAAYALELVVRLRDQEGACDLAAGGRRVVERDVGVTPLEIVEIGERPDTARERGMRSDVLDLLARVPERRRPLAQPL